MSWFDFLWQRRGTEADINPPAYFDRYTNAIRDIEQGAPLAEDVTLLAQSWKIFDNESARRGTIDSRASALMPATGLAVTLVTGVGFTILKEDSIPMIARGIMLVAFLLALVYLARTTFLLFRILGKVFRSALDPSDLHPPAADPNVTISRYDRQLACKILRYLIANYRVNNDQSDALFAAQHAFRNAILVVALGGAFAAIAIFLAALVTPANPLLPGFRLVLTTVGAQP